MLIFSCGHVSAVISPTELPLVWFTVPTWSESHPSCLTQVRSTWLDEQPCAEWQRTYLIIYLLIYARDDFQNLLWYTSTVRKIVSSVILLTWSHNTFQIFSIPYRYPSGIISILADDPGANFQQARSIFEWEKTATADLLILSICNKFSIRFRSWLIVGKGKMLILSLNQLLTCALERLGSLSCWKVKRLPKMCQVESFKFSWWRRF